MSSSEAREVIFEYLKIENIIRVTAVDSVTGTEVVFQAPANTKPADLQKLAIRKLKYVIKKQEVKE